MPQLERFVEGQYCMSMGMLWALSASLPYSYTHSENTSPSASSAKNPLLTSFQLLMKLVSEKQHHAWFQIRGNHKIFFLFLYKICFGNALEAPQQGTSN